MKKRFTIVSLAILASCAGGPDPIRYTAEAASYKLAVRCADGWFQGLPVVPADQTLVANSLADWAHRLDVDAEQLGLAKVGSQ